MKAARYEKQCAARDVLVVGEMDDPQPCPSEVRIRVAFSGVNPGDVKKREDAFGVGMLYPRVIPHSDVSGTVDAVGEGRERNYGVLCGGSDRVPANQPQAPDLCRVRLRPLLRLAHHRC